MSESGLTVKEHKKNSYIFIEEDSDSEFFYIIKSGKVETLSSLFHTGGNEILKEGGFFGVVSAMSGRPRTVSVRALENTRLIHVHRSQFVKLITRNTSVAMKIIRRFSQKLRYYDSLLMALYESQRREEDPQHLAELAEYYEKVENKPEIALEIYKKYVEQCPNGDLIETIRRKLSENEKTEKLSEPKQEGVHLIYRDQAPLFFEHEEGDSLYLIREGEVEVSKVINRRKVLLAILGEGSIVGEMAILDKMPRSASAFARGSVKVMRVTQQNFEHIVVTYPQIADKIIRFLSERIWLIYRKITNALISDPELRIYDALYTELIKRRVDTKQSEKYTFELSVADLSEQIGMSADNGRLLLRQMMEKDALLEVTRDRRVVYRDVSKIEERLNPVRRNLQIRENIQKMDHLL